MPTSSPTLVHITHSKRQIKRPRSILNDISNISGALANTEHGSSSGKYKKPTEDDVMFEDIFDEGYISQTQLVYYLLYITCLTS